ncbi:hypothetical protein JTE90_023506 [Oedothorax gibbosus]|uniref:Nose resistant to fluoxetine protein 6 n=1 Tax=Oedothorax gibbosus TaxID=931172 RepID=A0AAV6VRP8_9ARAC|nr:hypothetical protein JTE90_023506 [Oedothorax gibbosus]
MSALLLYYILFGPYHENLSLVDACFYNSISRILFACGVAWAIYNCVTGQAGLINSILSFKLFIPLSRLTYCAYLVHPMILTGYFGSLKVLFNFSHMTLVLMFLGFLLLSYSAALVTSLLFESPVIRLDKFIRNKFTKT